MIDISGRIPLFKRGFSGERLLSDPNPEKGSEHS